jgi:hypothetical protein
MPHPVFPPRSALTNPNGSAQAGLTWAKLRNVHFLAADDRIDAGCARKALPNRYKEPKKRARSAVNRTLQTPVPWRP